MIFLNNLLKIKRYLTTSKLGDVFDIINVILSLGMALIHIVDSYYNENYILIVTKIIKF